MMRVRSNAAVLLVALAAQAAWGCGVCVEDKVAATYDYAVVQRAAANGQAMVYCEIRGALEPQRWRDAARQLRGVDPASVRVAAQPAAISFALDTSRQSPQAAVAALQRAVPRTRVAMVRLVSARELAASSARR